MKKLMYHAIMALIILTCIGIIVFSYFLFLHKLNPITINSEPVHAVAIGDKLYFNFSYCRNTNVEAHVSRTFVDGLVYFVPEEQIAGTDKGCYTNNRVIEIPKVLPNGKYYMVTKLTYQVNPLAVRTVVWQTDKFTVNR